jgi:hypothetical protein
VTSEAQPDQSQSGPAADAWPPGWLDQALVSDSLTLATTVRGVTRQPLIGRTLLSFAKPLSRIRDVGGQGIPVFARSPSSVTPGMRDI